MSDLSNGTWEGKANPWDPPGRGEPSSCVSCEHPKGGWLRDSVCLFQPPFQCLPFAFCILTFTENPFLWWCKAQGGAKPKEEDREDFGPRNTYKRREGGRQHNLWANPQARGLILVNSRA